MNYDVKYKTLWIQKQSSTNWWYFSFQARFNNIQGTLSSQAFILNLHLMLILQKTNPSSWKPISIKSILWKNDVFNYFPPPLEPAQETTSVLPCFLPQGTEDLPVAPVFWTDIVVTWPDLGRLMKTMVGWGPKQKKTYGFQKYHLLAKGGVKCSSCHFFSLPMTSDVRFSKKPEG